MHSRGRADGERTRGRRKDKRRGACRFGSLQKRRHEELACWKMVSVRGELSIAYNLMFSSLDSFSMGNRLEPVQALPLLRLYFFLSLSPRLSRVRDVLKAVF